jgi:DMSO/TMAO reductase YedYZ molybdopterin-dependent catalytic subunit
VRDAERFLAEHAAITRRFFLRLGAVGLAASSPLGRAADRSSPERARAIMTMEPYFTPQDEFRDVSRGQPLPHSLPDAKKREVGLTRDTWRLEVLSDPDHPATLGRQFTRIDGTALDFDGLLRLGAKHAVRFPKVMTCLNIGCPLGMGLWEGVPLRDVLWLTQPRENVRRVFYYGYHNDDPKQMFRSSLPVGRVLEDPDDLPPVILCYKLNGEWLTSERGGPVRVVVPEAYGFKSIKWVSHVVLTNLYHANDTYADRNNDVDSPLKTFAATLSVPAEVKPGEPIPVSGYAQVGVSGLSKVQVWVSLAETKWPADDPHFTTAPWTAAEILAPPVQWDGQLLGDALAKGVHGLDPNTGRPRTWPMRLCKAHWAAVLPGLTAGDYTLRCRTVDAQGTAQPMPRPFRKSGRCDIEAVPLKVKA